MTNNILAAALALAAAASTASDLPPQRSMGELQGECSNYGWNLKREFELWGAKPAAVAAKSEAVELPSLNVGTRTDVALVPHAGVKFVLAPQKDRGGPDKYSGLVSFVPATDGVYRVSASSGVWIDAVVAGTVVPSARFEMQTKCTTIFKSVAFELKGGAPVVLQINGSATPTVGLLVTPWSD